MVEETFEELLKKFAKEKDELLVKIEKYHTASFEEHVEDFVATFFDEWAKEDIDFDYLLKIHFHNQQLPHHSQHNLLLLHNQI